MKKPMLFAICGISAFAFLIVLLHADPPRWVSGRDHHLSAYASCNRSYSRPENEETHSDAYAGSWGLDRARIGATAHVGDTRNSDEKRVTGGASMTKHARGPAHKSGTASAHVDGRRTTTNPQGDTVHVRRWYGRQAQIAAAND